MTLKHSVTVIGLAFFTLVGAASAQDAPAAGTPEVRTGPEWWVFSRGDARIYLIDVNSVDQTGDELTVSIARVPRSLAAGDYSHTVDQFGIRCSARQSHVVTSADAVEDGTLGDPFTTDEPWADIARNSVDHW